MAKQKMKQNGPGKKSESTSEEMNGAAGQVEREGPNHERLSEERIDEEIASQTAEGGHSVSEDEIREAFEEEE